MADRGIHKQHHDWRKKEMNKALLKHTKEEFLKNYTASVSPFITNSPCEIISHHSLPPMLLKHFVGSCSNSRKVSAKEALPEWYIEDAVSPSKPSQNIEEIEEIYSKIDVNYENSIKVLVEEDEKYPDWDDISEPVEEEPSSISYPLSLVSEHAEQGNPFACIIITHSILYEAQLIPDPHSIPFEKVWFYKDPQNNTQGPFSTIEMFNWSAAGFFNSNLQVAHSTPTHFFSLQMYIMQEKSKQISKFTNR